MASAHPARCSLLCDQELAQLLSEGKDTEARERLTGACHLDRSAARTGDPRRC